MKESLIANSGIQFLDVNIQLPDEVTLAKKKRDFAEVEDKADGSIELVFPYYRNDRKEYIIKDGINEEAIDPRTGTIYEEDILDDFSIPLAEDQIYKITYQEALTIFEETWIPIPYLKMKETSKGKRYLEGPFGWSRMYIAKKDLLHSDEDYTHRVILAFDTRTGESNSEYEILQTNDVDQTGRTTFACPDQDQPISNFYIREWVVDWLGDIFYDRVDHGIYRDRGDFPSKFAGAYLTLLTMLREAEAFPDVQVFGHMEKSIDVSLVLDIGNSRTCGLVLETGGIGNAPFKFREAEKLAIRDLSKPNREYNDPFEMKVVFAKELFGDDDYTQNYTETDNLFSWPSLVRVGPEATRLISLGGSEEEAIFHLSSPKRYLWDNQPVFNPWKSVKINLQGDLEFDTTFFGIAQHFTDEGHLIVYKDNDPNARRNGSMGLDYTGKGEKVLKEELRTGQKLKKDPVSPVTAPVYSRSTLMTFAIFELLLHALSQMNSVSYRAKKENKQIPRRLRHLVLTCPTAMTQVDQKKLKNAADDAVDLLKLYFDESFINFDLKIIPAPINTAKEKENPPNWMYDEATCSQLAYLYGEIIYRFNSDTEQYFKYCGKINEKFKYPKERSITIASIDIGGGTTDVMIAGYQLDPNSNKALIVPQPFFWEGFNLAGDDLMKRIIERIILPQLFNYANSKGAKNTKALMSDLFGPHTGKLTVNDIRLKNHLVNQLVTPLAYGFLDFASDAKSLDKVKLDYFFYKRPRPNQSILDELNERFKKQGAVDFDIEEMDWEISLDSIDKVISQAIGGLLSHISSIISQYGCDIVLLSGRPTQIPAIKNIIIRNLPVFPDKIVPLGNYRIGFWYPFSDSYHHIKDSKTIVCVGAAISHISESGNLGAFSFNTEPLKAIKSTAHYIGKYNINSAKIKKEEVYFGKDDEQAEVILSGGSLLIGKRQLAFQDWLAAPIYQIKYKDKDTPSNLNARGLRPPFNLTLTRLENSIEELKAEPMATDAENNDLVFDEYFTMEPQSLADEFGYWLDTGCFLLDIIPDSK